MDDADMVRTIGRLGGTVVIVAVLGAIIGFFSRGRRTMQWVISIAVSSALFLYFQFQGGTLSLKASLLENLLGGVPYLIAPFVVFFLLPTIGVASLVGRWRSRRRSPDHETI
jgi:hypothetical protein